MARRPGVPATAQSPLGALQAQLHDTEQLRALQETENKRLHAELQALQAAAAQHATELQTKDAALSAAISRLDHAERENELLRTRLSAATKQVPRAAGSMTPGQRISPRPPLNPELNDWDENGGFPLYGPAAGGNCDEVRRLLKAGADADMRTTYGWTALHWAAANGHREVVELLLYYWANVNAVSDTGKKPLAMTTDEEMRRVLLEWGAEE